VIGSPEPLLATARSSPVISIALIEDNRLVREGITALLSQVSDLVVLDPDAARDHESEHAAHPHVVLLDLGLSNGDALREVARVKACHPAARIVVMDLVPVHEDLVEFVHAGVAGFIMKDATLDDLVSCIRLVARGVDVLPTPLIGSLFSQIARQALAVGRPAAMDAVRMTPREREVVDCIAEGLGNKEIARRLRIATHTVKSHVRNVMEKLALHTRLQIAAFVHRDDPK
jgi:two-component system nitrate/nitrite response regulator NarL